MTKDNLRDRSRAGLAWDLIGTLLRQLFSLVVTIVLARLLMPEQFGLIGIALVFVAVSQVFMDVGFSDGLIQQKNVSQKAYSTVFYLNLAISLLMMGLIYMSGPWIGDLYHNEELCHVVRYLAIVLPLTAFGKVHAAKLLKELKFKSLAVRDILSTLAGGVAGVVGAMHDMEIYSLVLQQITSAFVSTMLLWAGTRWIPSVSFSWFEVKPIFTFSVFVFVDHFLREVFQKLDTLFIGKFFSLGTLGFYSRAESLNAQVMSFTSNSLRKVIFPVFSIIQNDHERFKRYYFKAFKLSAMISTILAGVLFFLADEIILGLFGNNWVPSIAIFQILVFRIVTAPFGALMGKALLSRGLSKIKFRVGLVQRAIMLTPIASGYFYGIEVFALMVVISYLVATLINAWVIDRHLKISFIEQVQSFVKPYLPLLVVSALSYAFFSGISSFILVSVYLVGQFLFLITTRDEGYLFAIQEFNNLAVKFSLVTAKKQ